MDCGARIKDLIEDSDIKQKALAAAISLNQSTLSNYITGRTTIPLDVLVQIANYFSTTTDYLLGRTDDISLPIQLSKEERAMLLSYRQLNREQRELIGQNIDFMLRQNQRD